MLLCNKKLKQHSYMVNMNKSANKITKWSAIGLLAAPGISSVALPSIGVGGEGGGGRGGVAHVTVSFRRCTKEYFIM